MMGSWRHRVPPWKGRAAAPLVECTKRPFFLPMTFDVETVHPLPKLALAVPTIAIDGEQLNELGLEVQ